MRVDPHHTLKHLGKGVDLFHDEGFLSDLDGREYRGCESSRLQREFIGISRVATCSHWSFRCVAACLKPTSTAALSKN